MRALLILLVAACDDPGRLVSDGAALDAAAHDEAGARNAPDLAVALPAHCPCPVNSYCDLASNSCKPGCLGDDQCPPGDRCDTHAFQCVLVCDPMVGCQNHVTCERQTNGFYICSGCSGGYDDCNHDPADGCETELDTDANCGKCGGAPSVTCLKDKDGDRYVVSSVTSTHCEGCPPGETSIYDMQGEDCDDNDANVNPDQTAFFAQPTASGGWDYNCDGFVEQLTQYDVFRNCGAACLGAVYWTSVPPQCGQYGDVTQCLNPPGGSCHTAEYPASFPQKCR